MKILLIGGSGLLGSELRKLWKNIEAPSSEKLNIKYLESFEKTKLGVTDYDCIVNLAAIKTEQEVEKYPMTAIHTNIIGSANCAIYAIVNKLRYVFISTDYVYPGKRGNYSETDDLQPSNKYAWTKLAGEASAKLVPNHLIIRTSFYGNEFPYNIAFANKYSSKDYLDVIAPKIMKAIVSNQTGVLNIGSQRRSIAEIARIKRPNTNIECMDESSLIPYDTSMNIDKLTKLERENFNDGI